MTGFKSGIHQFAPDQRQLFQPGAKQIDTLTTGDFAVKLIAFGDMANGDQTVRRHLPGRHSRHNRIGAVFLDIGEVAVVGILQRQMCGLKQIVVPARRQHRAHQRFTDLATVTAPVAANQLIEAADMVDAHQVVNLLARIRKVLADVFFDLHTLLFQLMIQHLFHQRAASATAGSGFGAGFQRIKAGCAIAHGLANLGFGHVMTGADLRTVGQRRHAEAFRGTR